MSVSVTLQSNSCSLTQCPVGYSLHSDQVPYPRANTTLEESAAIAALLTAFTAGLLLPFVLLGCLAAVLQFRSMTALAFLAITILDCFLPAGKVSSHPTGPEMMHATALSALLTHSVCTAMSGVPPDY